MKDKKKKLQKLTKILLTLLIIAGSIYLFRYAQMEHIRDLVLSYGTWGEIVYVLCWLILPIFLFPVPIIAFAGGLIYGLVKGTILTMIGAMINVVIMYYISRYIAKDFVENLVLTRVTGKLREKLLTDDQVKLGLLFFVLRIMPIVSFNFENYLAGITNIKLGVHFIASFIGIIPGTIIFLNFGDKAFDPADPSFIIAAILLVLLIVVPIFFTKKYFGDLVGKSNNNNTDIQRVE